MARIFAKSLNCVKGPTTEPCNECDICQSISAGQDVDVIEIDGASNNGVESVRELRQNAGLRPSRARYKIYYIDEVHMLSTGAFNALLKTLEEPPEHVKFFFATTEPNKIPITVLSRCQKFDFAGIRPEQITETLSAICEREGVPAEPEALQVLARRAGGSMRDAQSLLEQLLSSADKLTADTVHAALGLAPDDRVLDLIDALADGSADRALTLLDQAVNGGIQPVDLLSETLEFLRDVMVLAAGAPAEMLNTPPALRDRLQKVAQRWPIDSILAALQILAEYRGRLRGSPHGRLLVELALCRVARLEDLADLGDLVARLSGGGGPQKKKPLAPVREAQSRPPTPPRPQAAPAAPIENGTASQPEPVPPASPQPSTPAPPEGLSLESVQGLWDRLVEGLSPSLRGHLEALRPTALPEPGVLVVAVPPMYNWRADACESPESQGQIEARLRTLLGRSVSIRFRREAAPASNGEAEPKGRSLPSVHPDVLAADPLVQDVLKLFEARPVRVEPEENPET
jgi:DNA polymerase-3 subunit gamma/tau